MSSSHLLKHKIEEDLINNDDSKFVLLVWSKPLKHFRSDFIVKLSEQIFFIILNQVGILKIAIIVMKK